MKRWLCFGRGGQGRSQDAEGEWVVSRTAYLQTQVIHNGIFFEYIYWASTN